MLGSTFNSVFEYQMEHLQNGDRFYYLSRTQGMNLLNQLEPTTFADLVMRNTDLGDRQLDPYLRPRIQYARSDPGARSKPLPKTMPGSAQPIRPGTTRSSRPSIPRSCARSMRDNTRRQWRRPDRRHTISEVLRRRARRARRHRRQRSRCSATRASTRCGAMAATTI